MREAKPEGGGGQKPIDGDSREGRGGTKEGMEMAVERERTRATEDNKREQWGGINASNGGE